MGFVVKNTTKSGVLDLLCPHSCRGCGHLGSVLCERCKKYMLEQRQMICPICKRAFAKKSENVADIEKCAEYVEKVNNYAENGGKSVNKIVAAGEFGGDELCGDEEAGAGFDENGQCRECETEFAGIYCFGWREGALEKLVEEYKYQSVRAMGEVLVDLYDEILPREWDGEVVVVPLPTIGKHVRERGFDHTLTLAKKLAKRRGWKCEQLLTRELDTVQVGAKVAERKVQAQKAYGVRGKVRSEVNYLLLDDVWTTGSTMEAARRVMQEAGAGKIFAAVLAVSRMKE